MGDATAPARDEVLKADLVDLLEHDDRLRDARVSLEVRGGIAHVAGALPSPELRPLLRRAVRRQAGLYAAWDLLAVPGERLRVADIGCGAVKQTSEAVGVDRVCGPAVDVLADLERGLPFADASLDHVFAVHVLEHVRDLVALMAEVHRVLRPGGLLHVLAPHWRHRNAVADPTRRLVDPATLAYFCEPGRSPRWRPLLVAASDDTVFADLEALSPTHPADLEAFVRCFG